MTDVADECAGQARPCGHCGKTIVVLPAVDLAPKRKVDPLRGCLVFLLLMMGCDTLGMLFGLLLPSVQSQREAGRYATCVNNLKQIALAMQRYHQAYGPFPPSFIPDENGKPKHSWRVLILPFLEEQDLYASYRFDEPWNSPNNMALARQMPRVYGCPSDPPADRSQTSYTMIVGPHAISDGPTARRVSDVKGGPSNTILVAETTSAEIKWLEPRDLNTKDMVFRVNALRDSPRERGSGISSRHPGRANVVFCDGTVHTIDDVVDEKVLKAMLTINGGEAIAPRVSESP